jgi:hypothetical protein
MNKMSQRALWVVMTALALGGPGVARAADLQFDIQPRVLRLGESATLSLTVMGLQNVPVPELPAIPGFQTEFIGKEQSFSFGTGGQNISVTFRYRLVPTQMGTFPVGPFQYPLPGQTIEIPAISIKVVGADGANQQLSDLFFVKLQTARNPVYHQEMFDLYVYLYYKGYRVASDLQALNWPATGLSLQPLQEMPATREAIGDDVYEVRRFRTKAQALTTGKFVLQPSLRIGVLVPRQRSRRSTGDPFFDNAFQSLFFDNYETQTVEVPSHALELSVLPLPAEGRPAGFSGAVGRFEFSADLRPREAGAGEPMTLVTRITGEGNIDSVTAPPVAPGELFKVYEPRLAGRDMAASGGAGQKSFEQVFIPRTAISTNFPEITFSYFDPEAARYREIRQGPFPIVIRAAAEGSRIVQALPESSPSADRPEARDILYLKPAPPVWRHRDQPAPLTGAPLAALQVTPPVLVAAVFLAWRRRQRLRDDIALARRLRAPRAAQASMRKARQAIAGGRAPEFYEALWEALTAYLGDRLNLPPGVVNADEVIAALPRPGAPPDLEQRIRTLFSVCEAARFGHIGRLSEPEHMSGALNDLHALLQTCEKLKP